MRVCTLQPEINPGKRDENLKTIRKLLESASRAKPFDLAVLPENFPYWGSKFGRGEDFQLVLDFLSRTAEDLSINLIGGSFHHQDPDSGMYHNSCHIFNRKGGHSGVYHKRKLFDREVKFGVIPGTKPVVVNIEGWRVAVQICADLWYPELAREVHGQFDMLIVPAQSVVRNGDYQGYGRNLWHNLAMTRAQENAVVTVVSDHPALPRKPLCSGGFSICDPSMSMLTSDLTEIQLLFDDGAPGFLTQELNLERLREFQKYRTERGMLPISG